MRLSIRVTSLHTPTSTRVNYWSSALRVRLKHTMADHSSSTAWPAKKVRETFFEYFRSKGHTFVPSSSTIPYEDPTLLFANAGMNQVSDVAVKWMNPIDK